MLHSIIMKDLNPDIVIYLIILFGIVLIVYGFIGLVRQKVSMLHRNHIMEGHGAIFFSTLFIITGFGLLLSVYFQFK